MSLEQQGAVTSLRLVRDVHEWVLQLEGADFDPDAVSHADRQAVEALNGGATYEDALEVGRDTYIRSCPGSQGRVLVVDDEDDVRTLLRLTLSQPELSVVGEAADGAEAIEMVARQRPHAVVLDLNMPRMDGVQALRQIKERWPDTHVIIHTAFGDVFRPKLTDVNFDDFVEKTGSFDELVEHLRAACA